MNIDIISYLLNIVAFVLGPIFSAAVLVYLERKVIAAVQLRVGPSVVGPFGILQAFADAFKTIFKEVVIPGMVHRPLFLFAPFITFVCAVSMWAFLPISESMFISNMNIGVAYVMIISALGVYGFIIAGWASNSKYAFFGAIRSASQMISYEVSIGFSILCVCIMSQSMNMIDIVNAQRNLWFCFNLFPVFIIFFISILAETNRHPFDLPEAESELVSGYNVEYSSTIFTLFFLSEYMNMIAMSVFCTILFLGGWLPPFSIHIFNAVPGFIWLALKVLLLLYIFIIVRAATPRYRYDQLMYLSWQIFLPISLLSCFFVGCYKFFVTHKDIIIGILSSPL